MPENDVKVLNLNDSVIAHVARLLQVSMLTGTDIVDHMRMIRLVENENGLILIISGGLFYTLGVIFFIWDRILKIAAVRFTISINQTFIAFWISRNTYNWPVIHKGLN